MSVTDETAVAGNGAPEPHVGRALRRKEDPRLITGRARYVDDIPLPDTAWAAFVRSPEAHARIVSIDASAAKAREGVVAVFTGPDMADLGGPLPMAWVPPGVEVKNPEHWPIARDAVKHVGDPVAVVLGEDRYAVIDAVEDVRRRVRAASSRRRIRRPRSRAVRSCTSSWEPTRSTSGRCPAATSTPASPRPRSRSSGGSSTTGRREPRSSRAACSPTTAPAS